MKRRPLKESHSQHGSLIGRPQVQLFVAVLKHLGSDCATTGSGKAAFVYKHGDETVRVTVEVVEPGQNSWEVIDTNGGPILHLHGVTDAAGVIV
jgi:hypothetical protein